MKTLSRIETFKSTPEKVFQCLDDLGVIGMHMTKSSMGGRLNLEFITSHKTGLGSKYGWTGNVMSMVMDFTVEVTKWIQGKEKTWETIGDPKVIIYSWYRMHLMVSEASNNTQAELSISYEKPKGWFNKLICFLLGDWYCRWCLKHMLGDCKNTVEGSEVRKEEVTQRGMNRKS